MACATFSTLAFRDAEAMAPRLLSISDLSVVFRGETGERSVLDKVSLTVGPGEIVGLVGESGSGKSVTALAVMRLLGAQGKSVEGKVLFDGTNLTALSEADMLKVRGRRIAMIFQEPMTSLNPLFTVGFQVAEVLRNHLGLKAGEARQRTVTLLDRVGIPSAQKRYDNYPHQLSGGMRQRVMIAMAIACRPQLLIADEPTTALDVTIQAQILALTKELRSEEGSAILLITHDMGVIARMADRVAVMYAGQIVEVAPLRDIFTAPAHPYTRLLLASMPTVRRKSERLPVIPGMMPSPGAMPSGCRFHPRCPIAEPACRRDKPLPEMLSPSREVRCWRAREVLRQENADGLALAAS
jgi:peptide/nickel transport system ATP-binding protein